MSTDWLTDCRLTDSLLTADWVTADLSQKDEDGVQFDKLVPVPDSWHTFIVTPWAPLRAKNLSYVIAVLVMS